MEWTTACPDWEARVTQRESLIPFKPLFKAEADSAYDVFGDLRIVDAPGSPMMRDACKEWVADFVRAVFGAYDHESGRRLIREFLLLIAKKNAKSTTAAAIMLTALVRNWRKSAEFLIVAPTLEIANNSYLPAADMVRTSTALSALMHIQPHTRTITHRGTRATLKVVAADNEAVGGKKAVGVLIDELWLFGKRADAENMLREATGGMASRPEGFTIYLSTQSDEPPSGVFRQKLQYARGVRDGRIADKRFLPVLYEFPERMIREDLFRDPANFYVTNPNLGASVDREFLEREFAKAQEAGEQSLRGFFAKNLNVEIGLSLRSDRWAGADHWEASADKTLTFDELIRRCDVVVVGIDGGGLDDLFGLAVIGRERGTRKWLLWCHAWAYRTVLERRKSEAARLRDFVAQGDLTIVDNLGQDISEIVAVVERLNEAGLLPRKHAVGLDPMGIGPLVDALAERGIAGELLVGVPQGWKMVGNIKTTERKLAEGTLVHAAQPLMDWCVGNAKVVPKGNAIAIDKQISGAAKIDPLIASFNAVSLMGMNPDGGSVWEEHGVRSV